MKQTITQKILAAHCNKKQVHDDELISASVDIALGNDITTPLAVKEFRAIGAKKVFDRNKMVLVLDHFTPNKDILSAEQCKFLRQFAKEQKLNNFYEGGNVGVEHTLLPDEGLVTAGDLVIGADSHTCTYGAMGAFSTGVGSTDLAAVMVTGKIWLRVPETIKVVFQGKLRPWVTGKDLIIYLIGQIGVDGANYCALEFCGPVIRNLSMAERFTMCNMAIEAGGKNGIIEPDEITFKYLKAHTKKKSRVYHSDKDANYKQVIEIDVSRILPQVAVPHLPSNAQPARTLSSVYLDQVVIGSCTNGRIEDLRVAAKILKGQKVYSGLRLIVLPATPKIYKQAIDEGLINIFLDAGAVIGPPTCGPCLGGHMGILAAGEKCLATTNRNFVGRMGSTKGEVYLASPATAAISAVKGCITDPSK